MRFGLHLLSALQLARDSEYLLHGEIQSEC